MSQEKAHATFGASSAERWLNCSGSIKLCEKAPPAPESEYAAEGTKAHECLEYILKNHSLVGLKKLALKKYPLEMVEYAMDAADYITARARETPSANILCETKVDASPFTCEGQFGTLDAAIVAEFDRLIVIDYKYGAGIGVDPEYNGEANPQLCYYALGISHQYDHNFSEVELVVIQPRAYHESGETIRSAVFSMEEILKWGERFKAGVIAAKDPSPKFKSGKWCRFCQGALICPELKTASLKEAQIVFDDVEGLETLPEINDKILPHLGVALQAADKIEAWIKKLRDHAFYLLENGHAVEGYKLVEKRGLRKWIDPEKTAIEARKAYQGVLFSVPELLSPAQAEKVLPGVIGKKWVAERCAVKSSGLTMVQESDKRPAVKTIDLIFNDEKDK